MVYQGICKNCEKNFKSRDRCIFCSNMCANRYNAKIYSPWNKGLTKETDKRIKKRSERFK